ncbi:hypothetical protein LXM50_05645 [Microbacterium sp. Au-Mic1]|uniref:hypothetical protein n=1 Tax=Microbacterium sp. Au-Mic1 TaxID=2906457 RepID=UPI001E42C922|nr:hypothetical protein [Microbacterium sp. Au-Mic1]MCE4025449.1 hypothetical protein [Microbacterium sp. Au-Mic1]
MSFDIYFQRFENGDAASGGGAAASEVLRAFLRPSPQNPERIEHPGGSAEIYGLSDEGMMATHVDGGDAIWDLLVSTARAANWTILPVGCAVCIFTTEMEAALPEGLGDDGVKIIESGADLLRVIAES